LSLSDQLTDIINSLGGFGPSLWLAVAFCGLLVIDLLTQKKNGKRRLLAVSSIIAVAIAGIWALLSPVRGFLFLRLLFVDNQAIAFQLIIAIAAVMVLLYELFTVKSDEPSVNQPVKLPVEWYSLLLAMTLGLFLMTMSVNLLSIYLSIELVSICSYLLTALTTTRKASEGGMKYLLFGSVSSAIMLYGMSLLYGMTGTLDLTAEAFALGMVQQDIVVVAVAGVLTLAGLLFKLAGVPFHVWTPDAYDAAPIPVAAFFSVAPKAAGLLVLMRVVTALPAVAPTGGATAAVLQTPLAVLALAGILIGNLSALWQTDAKRLLAYSAIAQAGFLLVGVVALSDAGFEAAVFYAATYLFISLASFFLVDLLARSTGRDTLTITDFAGLGARQPVLSIALMIVMLALTGLPPTVGFTAKLLSFSALFDTYQRTGNGWLLALFGLGLLNALISLAYYIKIPFFLFFRTVSAETVTVPLPKPAVWLAVGLVVPVLLLFVKPDWLLEWFVW
jgi:NADH-quinone oxidoreductase subunit N